jgi:uncharacterized protein involved in response to NO
MRRALNAALLSSGFRPFFLLGAGYGPLVLIFGWLPLWGGFAQGAHAMPPPALWHGHELIYGFASAFICGFVLTALPSWAETPEIKPAPLALLVSVWICGRIAAWSYAWLPVLLIGALDLLLFATLAAIMLPWLLRVIERRYLALLPILIGFLVCDAMFYVGVATGAFETAERALQHALNVVVVLFTLVSGFLTPVFSEAERQEHKLGGRPLTFWPPLEIAAIGSAVLFAAADWTGAPPAVNGGIACIAALIHTARLCRWRGFSFLSLPLIFAKHVGYAWLVVAMALRGLADLFALVPRAAWIHAFTVGALGMTMLALASRVTLRHTGRVPRATALTVAALLVMFAAGLTRVGASLADGGRAWMLVSAFAWAAAFSLFLVEQGGKLWRPSLPRVKSATAGRGGLKI